MKSRFSDKRNCQHLCLIIINMRIIIDIISISIIIESQVSGYQSLKYVFTLSDYKSRNTNSTGLRRKKKGRIQVEW